MTEILAAIQTDGKIALVDTHNTKLTELTLNELDAACLARGLLSCAALLAAGQAPQGKPLIADVHFPILKWSVSTQTETGKPVIVFSIPPGIDVTFQITPTIEKELADALTAHAEGLPPPARKIDRLQ
jgi:hypothetical protein